MIRYHCISCKKEYKRETCKVEQTTHGLCSTYCKQSLDLWLNLPRTLRGRLADFHRERKRLQSVN